MLIDDIIHRLTISGHTTMADGFANAVTKWSAMLQELGVDISLWAPIRNEISRAADMRARAQKIRRDIDQMPTSHQQRVAQLVSGADDDLSGDRRIQEQRDEQAALSDAAERIEKSVRGMLTRLGSANVEMLKPVYLEACEKLMQYQGTFDGWPKLDEAARRGFAAEYLEMERLAKTIETLRKFASQFRADRIAPAGTRPYSPEELYYRDRMIARAAREFTDGRPYLRGESPQLMADMLAAAGPAFRTPAEAEEVWSKSIDEEENDDSMSKAYGQNPTQWDAAKEQARAAYLKSISVNSFQ